MKHLKDARKLLTEGDAQGALDIIENILAFSSKNPEALTMKADILDRWGRFDDSLAILHFLTKVNSSNEVMEKLQTRIEEDRESMIYSRLTSEGRWYFPFSPMQVFVSLFGLMGCLIFLITSPAYFKEAHGGVLVGILFFCLVFVPWVVLMFMNLRGVKKILVGLNGISVFYSLKKQFYAWDQVGCVVVEYDPNIHSNYLKMIFYSRSTREPLFNLDISDSTGVVKARRHFVRLVLSYVDIVSYVSRGRATEQAETTSQKAA